MLRHGSEEGPVKWKAVLSRSLSNKHSPYVFRVGHTALTRWFPCLVWESGNSELVRNYYQTGLPEIPANSKKAHLETNEKAWFEDLLDPLTKECSYNRTIGPS